MARGWAVECYSVQAKYGKRKTENKKRKTEKGKRKKAIEKRKKAVLVLMKEM